MSGLMMPQFWTEAEMTDGFRRPGETGRALVSWLIGRKAKAAPLERRLPAKDAALAADRYLADLW